MAFSFIGHIELYQSLGISFTKSLDKRGIISWFVGQFWEVWSPTFITGEWVNPERVTPGSLIFRTLALQVKDAISAQFSHYLGSLNPQTVCGS